MAKDTTDKKVAEVTDVLEELEQLAIEAVRKQGFLQNEGGEFDRRATIEKLLKAGKRPTSAECNKLAFDLLDYYCTTELEHSHNSKGEIIIKSLKHEWTRKVIRAASGKIEGFWEANHDMDENEKEETAPVKRGRKSGTLKERTINQGKKALTKTLVRKVSRNLVEGSQGAIVHLLASTNPELANDPGFKEKLGMFMATDIGKALIAGGLSLAVDYIPGLPEQYKDVLTEELQTDAMDYVTSPLENLAKAALPMLASAIGPLLPGHVDNSKLLDGAANQTTPAQTATTPVPPATPSSETTTPPNTNGAAA